jgi:hypothetical protein
MFHDKHPIELITRQCLQHVSRFLKRQTLAQPAVFVQEMLDVGAESAGIHHLGENCALGAKHH